MKQYKNYHLYNISVEEADMSAAKELKKEGYGEHIFDGNDREKFDLLRMVYQKKLNA